MVNKKPPVRSPTLQDVADAVGVTKTTVSNAYNRPDQLSAPLRERVLEAAAKLGYTGPDAAARSLRHGRSKTVGVVYADPLSHAFADAAFVQFLEGLASAVEQDGISLTLMPGTPRDAPTTLPVTAAVVDAFVVYSMADDDPLLEAARERRLPLICIDAPELDRRAFVGVDDSAGAETAARHLLGLGHRALGVITSELTWHHRSGVAMPPRRAAATDRVARERLSGYAAAFAGSPVSWDDVPVYEAVHSEAGGIEAAGWLLEQRPRPTGILAMSDRLALSAIAAAQARGLRIPQDLSVIGYDDIPAAAASRPPLTTISQPHTEKGRLAGQLAKAAITGRRLRRPTALPTQLVIRDTTAPPPRKSR